MGIMMILFQPSEFQLVCLRGANSRDFCNQIRQLSCLIVLVLWSLSVAAVQINVDSGSYSGQWKIVDNTGYLTGDQTIDVAPGVRMVQIGYSTNGKFNIDVAANGDITSLNPIAATGVGNVLSFNTTEMIVDVAGYANGKSGAAKPGLWSVSGVASFRAYRDIGPQTIYVVPSLGYIVSIGIVSKFNVEVAANGDVTSLNPDAAIGGGNVLTFNSTQITVDPYNYDDGSQTPGAWGVLGIVTFGVEYGPQNIDLVPNLRYTMQVATNRTAFNFEVEANGNVISLDLNKATAAGSVLTFNTTPIVIDTASYGDDSVGQWHLFQVDNNLIGTNYFNVVPGLNYEIKIGCCSANKFSINVDANGDVSSLNSDAAIGTGNELEFNTTVISIDVGAYTGSWQLVHVTTQGQSGNRDVIVVPGVSYTFDGNPIGSQQFSVAEPCAVDPTQFYSSGFEINITCGALDADEDGVPDDTDNCPDAYNPDQVDQDLDGLGNVCDQDLDGDGVANTYDNCPDVENTGQEDFDSDNIGNECDEDADNDAVPDDEDNCRLLPNTDQANNDFDSFGDACDEDDDNDGIEDTYDNCPFDDNPAQDDFDGNGQGDVCDGDIDGDGVSNDNDLCPGSPFSQLTNADGCNGSQHITLLCDAENFVQHGQYVSCVAHAAKDAADAGLISNKEKARFVKQAAQSNK